MKNLERKPVPAAPPAPPGTLAAALAALPDPRRPYGWRPQYPPLALGAVLQVAVAAMLCGARGVTAIAQWVRERSEDDPALLADLGLPPARRPCAATFHRLFQALDAAAFEQAVGGWLAATGVRPTEPLAVDGKTLRGSGTDTVPAAHLVGVYAHESAVILAQLRTAGKGHELPAAKAVLRTVPLAGRLVTGDALFTQREVCDQIVADGGDYLFPVDGNQPQLQADLAEVFSPLDADAGRRAGAADAAPVAGGGVADPRRPVECRDAAGAESPPRAPRRTDGVDAGRPPVQ
jgi:hypothetical protein